MKRLKHPGFLFYVALFLFCAAFIFGVGKVKGEPEKFPFPELTVCKCNSSYWCLTQDEVIRLNMFYAQEPTQFIPVDCEACE